MPLWNAFQRLNATRSYHMAGPNPISFAEIEAFTRLIRQPLEPWQVAILLDMDAAWLGHAMKGGKVPEGVKALPPISKQPLNAAPLDVVMGLPDTAGCARACHVGPCIPVPRRVGKPQDRAVNRFETARRESDAYCIEVGKAQPIGHCDAHH